LNYAPDYLLRNSLHNITNRQPSRDIGTL